MKPFRLLLGSLAIVLLGLLPAVSPAGHSLVPAFAAPSNDSFANPIAVCSGGSAVSSTNDCSFSADNSGGATTEAGEGWTQTVWYSFVPASSGKIFIRATSGFDNTLHVRARDAHSIDANTSYSAGQIIALNDDFYGLDASVTPTVTAGQTYLVALGSYSSGYGAATISMTMSVPDIPTNLAATRGDGNAALTWAAADLNTRSLTRFDIQIHSADGSLIRTVQVSGSPPPTSTTVTGLTNGVAYKFKIRAVNQNGESVYSDFSNTVTPLGAPTAPLGFSVVAASEQLTVTFAAPASTGGSDITGYEYSLNSTSSFVSTGTGPGSFTVTGLNNGTAYTVRMRAINVIGNGAQTAAITVTPATLPSPPTLSSITPGSAQLSVSFNAGLNGGSSVLNYQYSTDGGTTYRALSPTATTSPIVISKLSTDGVTSLVNGESYDVRLRAVTSVGVSVDGSNLLSGTPRTSPSAPVISAITGANGQLNVTLSPSFNGGSSILNYEYSTDGTNFVAFSPAQTTSPLTISKLSSDGVTPLVNGTTYPVTVKAINVVGSSPASGSLDGTPINPPPPAVAPVVPPAVVEPPRVLPRVLPTPPPVVGPVVQNGGVSTPPSQPTALVGGRVLPVQTQVTDPNTMNLRAGVLNIGMNVPSNQGGGVSQQGGSTEVQVRNGGAATLNGSGLLPRSTVQVFMPLGGSNAREIARIPVDANGSFSGDAIFGATPTEAPLPIGRHVLQMVTVDENRQQTVVEITVNIAQPPPAPELNRSTNERPTLLPGQSIATNGGVPEPVIVTPIPDQKQATIQGDGWSMAVQADGDGAVAPGEGGAVVTFVRDQGAVVSGEGFMPGTRADVWLFSDPTLLGTVQIDANGEFNGTVNIDGNVVTVGEHTLQLQGVGEDGLVRAANLGVTVADEAPALTQESSGSLFWLWMLVLLGVVSVAAVGTWLARRAKP